MFLLSVVIVGTQFGRFTLCCPSRPFQPGHGQLGCPKTAIERKENGQWHAYLLLALRQNNWVTCFILNLRCHLTESVLDFPKISHYFE